METLEEAKAKILAEVTHDEPEVRADFLKHFEAQLKPFCAAMGVAFTKWQHLDAGAQISEPHSYVAALVYSAIALHIQSMRLFLSGHLVAAGNLSRQVAEAIALALLCSGQHLSVLSRFMAGTYSTSKAVDEVCRHYKTLNLRHDGVEALRTSQRFYHHYSHVTTMTIASFVSFGGEGVYVGASFDANKMTAYRKEMKGRVSLARVFPNFIDAVEANMESWK